MENPPPTQSEEEFLIEVQTSNALFDDDAEDGYDIHAFWAGGEHHEFGVIRKKGEQATYIIEGPGDDDDPDDDGEFIRTRSYADFCKAIDRINSMSWEEYERTFIR